MKNIIVSKMTATDWERFDDLLDQMEALLEGKLAVLDENGRVRYGSVNEQNKLLINKVWQFRQSKPAMSSPDVDWQAFEEDYNERERLETRGDRLSSIAYRFKSTKILHDYDNYQDALDDYAYSQYKKGSDADGFAEKTAELRQFFPKSGKEKPPEEGGNN
ncbi:MAG: hypothetical protein LUM44_21805 [Pyrinomonadaceae bacterium]|nr:hypothetical protein [Pyrinomonadaceae bacterium]